MIYAQLKRTMRNFINHALIFFFPVLLGIMVSTFSTGCDQPPTPAACSDNRTPIIFVHGALASGDTYSLQAQRFTSNGYCTKQLITFDWNTLNNGNTSTALEVLQQQISRVLQEQNVPKVVLIGHSAGASLVYNFAKTAENAHKLERVVLIGGATQAKPGGPDGSLPTLNIYSTSDTIVRTGGDIPGAQNVKLTTEDHYEVATGASTFSSLYAFLNNGMAPKTTDVQAEEEIFLSGKVVSLGENTIAKNATIKIFETDPATGTFSQNSLRATLKTDADGDWGPFWAKKDLRYAFQVIPANTADRKVVYYREPFTRSDHLVYLRTLPGIGSIAGLLTGSLPATDAETGLVVFSANKAIIHERDRLFIGSNELSLPTFASASQTTIAFFLYDDNGNRQSDLSPIPLFNGFPFLKGVDYYLRSTDIGPISLVFNNRTMNLARLQALKDGIVVAVFN